VLKDNKVMHSRMVRKGDTFATTVRIPPGMMLDYKLLITKTNRGAPVTIWQDNTGQEYHLAVRDNGSVVVESTLTYP
jgi:hypothetical protein